MSLFDIFTKIGAGMRDFGDNVAGRNQERTDPTQATNYQGVQGQLTGQAPLETLYDAQGNPVQVRRAPDGSVIPQTNPAMPNAGMQPGNAYQSSINSGGQQMPQPNIFGSTRDTTGFQSAGFAGMNGDPDKKDMSNYVNVPTLFSLMTQSGNVGGQEPYQDFISPWRIPQ